MTRPILSDTSRPAVRLACCTTRITSLARPSAASSGVTAVSSTMNPPPGSAAVAPALSSTTVSTVNSPAASSMPPQVTCPAGLSAQSPDLLARITDCTVLPSRGPAARAFTVRRRVSWICCASASATSSSVT